MECLSVKQILGLFRGCVLLTDELLIKAYNMINYKVVCENDVIDSMEIYEELVQYKRLIIERHAMRSLCYQPKPEEDYQDFQDCAKNYYGITLPEDDAQKQEQ